MKRHLTQILIAIMIIELGGLSGCFYYSYTHLKKDYNTLNQQYLKANEDLKLKNTEIDAKNKEIEDLEEAKNQSVQNEVASDAIKTNTETSESPSQSSGIYSHINGSDEFKNRIVGALDLLKAQDNEHYQTAANQVSSINEYDNYGGYQDKRDIYIGADGNPTITASLITHEAQHVYNVYVNKIYSYHTQEQELPCYEAELVTAQRIGAPAFFITSVQNNIDYWKTQP